MYSAKEKIEDRRPITEHERVIWHVPLHDRKRALKARTTECGARVSGSSRNDKSGSPRGSVVVDFPLVASATAADRPKFEELRPRLLEIGIIVPFVKPFIDREKAFARLVASRPWQACERKRGAQLPKAGALVMRNRQGPLELDFGLAGSAQGLEQFATKPNELGFEIALFGSRCRLERLIDQVEADLGLGYASVGCGQLAKVQRAKHPRIKGIGCSNGGLHELDPPPRMATADELGADLVVRQVF